MRSTKIGAVVIAGLLSVSLAACGSNSSTTGTASSSASAASPSAAATAPVAEIKDLSKGVSTAVKLDPAFLAALTSLKVTPSTDGKATLNAGVLSFPITGGNVTLYNKGAVDPYVQGMINHNGSGLSLTAGGIKVSLDNFVVDPGKSMLTGKVSANNKELLPSAPLFFLDGSTLQPVQMQGTNAILQGTTVKLTPEAVALLNKTFKLTGAKAIPAYFTVGVATITAATA